MGSAHARLAQLLPGILLGVLLGASTREINTARQAATVSVTSSTPTPRRQVEVNNRFGQPFRGGTVDSEDGDCALRMHDQPVRGRPLVIKAPVRHPELGLQGVNRATTIDIVKVAPSQSLREMGLPQVRLTPDV